MNDTYKQDWHAFVQAFKKQFFSQKNANYAQVESLKLTSTVLEPSIPFHTLVKFVDAEDIANDKIRTNDLTLEVNNITKQLHPRDPNNETKPTYKNYCTVPTVIEQSILSMFVSKNNEMMKTDVKLMQDQNLL